MQKIRSSYFWATLLDAFFFLLTMIGLAQFHESKSLPLLIVVTFLSGIFTGSFLNLDFAHVLLSTYDKDIPITTALFTSFRGFAPSFSSTISAGVFLKKAGGILREGIYDEELVRKLLGGPGLIHQLKGTEKQLAIRAYAEGVSDVFRTGTFIALGAILLIALTFKKEHRRR